METIEEIHDIQLENKRIGSNFLGILNDLKRRPEDAARELGVTISEINSIIDSENSISSDFTNALFIMSYASLFLFIANLFVDEGHPIEGIGSLIDLIKTIMLIVWGFKARNRVNAHCNLDVETDTWFHGFWTFMFSSLYFNYKVNCILESNVEQAAPADS